MKNLSAFFELKSSLNEHVEQIELKHFTFNVGRMENKLYFEFYFMHLLQYLNLSLQLSFTVLIQCLRHINIFIYRLSEVNIQM